MKLSEHLVKNKSRITNIGNIKVLNIWGCQISDISLFTEIPLIEILVLGNNQICSLHPLRNCHNLRELYLGKNLIDSFEELRYLKDAKSLTLLSLRDNPCSVAAGDSYRMSVLRILPQLITLDDEAITPKERQLLAHYQDPKWSSISAPPSQAAIPQKVAPAVDTVRGGPRRRSGSASTVSFRLNSNSVRDCLEQESSNRSQTPRDKAIASSASCVNTITHLREQELKKTLSQYYTDPTDMENRDRNASLLMASLALAKQMDATTLEVLCRAIQDQVLRLPL